MLLCDRPHVKDVDFDTVRFIVATASGLNVNGQHLVMGDEVPRGVLSTEALRQIYEPPLRLIETIDYAREDPSLVEACSRQGTNLDQDLPDDEDKALLEEANRDYIDPDAQSQVMCDECGAMFESEDSLSKHTKKQCKINQKRAK